MKLSELASKPQLIKITIDDELTKEEFGEDLEFWIYDRQDMDTYMAMANVKEDNMSKLAEVLSTMVLDEEGNKIIKDGVSLPPSVMMRVISKVVEQLGNSMSQTLTK
jgi:hypothetical protein